VGDLQIKVYSDNMLEVGWHFISKLYIEYKCTSQKICPGAISPTTNILWAVLGLNPDLHNMPAYELQNTGLIVSLGISKHIFKILQMKPRSSHALAKLSSAKAKEVLV
jgi:hypothetical protein